MACDILQGWTLGCRDNTGGVKNIYILSGSITGVTGLANGLATITGSGVLYKHELVKETGDFTENLVGSDENGTVFYDQILNAPFHKMQSALRNKIKVLAQNPAMRVVVETNNGAEDNVGKYFLLGYQNGMSLNSSAGVTGKGFGDANSYTLTFTGKEPIPAIEIGTSVSTSTDLTTYLDGITVG
jgi:hypothetical protein